MKNLTGSNQSCTWFVVVPCAGLDRRHLAVRLKRYIKAACIYDSIVPPCTEDSSVLMP